MRENEKDIGAPSMGLRGVKIPGVLNFGMGEQLEGSQMCTSAEWIGAKLGALYLLNSFFFSFLFDNMLLLEVRFLAWSNGGFMNCILTWILNNFWD